MRPPRNMSTQFKTGMNIYYWNIFHHIYGILARSKNENSNLSKHPMNEIMDTQKAVTINILLSWWPSINKTHQILITDKF